MKYELHRLNKGRLPFIFRDDEMHAGEKDFTHWHENIELLYFYEGDGVVTLDFRPKNTTAGDLVVVNSEKLHMVESAHAAFPVKYYCLIIDIEFCTENGIPAADIFFRELISGDAELNKKFQSVVSAYAGREEFKETAVRVAVLDLLLTLARKYALPEKDIEERDEEHLENVKEAVKYIKENYEKHISVTQVCRAAGLSEAYFSRIFKKVTGYTVVSYINLVRCRNADKLLRSGKYKVKEVAAQCGFENMSYFTKTYRAIMGALPSERCEMQRS